MNDKLPNTPANPSRRNFFVESATISAGLALALHFPWARADMTAPTGASTVPEVNAWVLIQPDDTVIVRIARSEMGQGTLTGLAQLVAEELECDWSKVTTEYASPSESVRRGRPWGMFGTYGSFGIRQSHEYVRKGGAAARMMLVQAAAERWGVDPSECTAAQSVITHLPTGRTLTFGAVAEAASHLQPPADIPLKSPNEWKLIGTPLRRLDTHDKVTGAQVYGADLQLPGMLNAAVRKCPVFGGKLKGFDAAAVAEKVGVRAVLRIGDNAVAVVADTWYVAKSALDQLSIVWDEGPNAKVSSDAIAARLDEGLTSAKAFVGNSAGDAPTALADAGRLVEATYSFPLQNHATMEPMNATVRYTQDRCEAWVPTQDGETALKIVANSSGLPIEQCEVYKLHLGGGFGRRAVYEDYLEQAVQIAKQLPGTPVKLLWSREEDMAQGRYHPIMHARLRGRLDDNNALTALHLRLSGQSIVASVHPELPVAQNGEDRGVFHGLEREGEYELGYDIPNLLIDYSMRNTHVPAGYWRGVNVNQNGLFFECFMDELAEAADMDAVEFRRRLMHKHPRHLRVLDAVASKIGWSSPPAPGVYRGIAQMKCMDSYASAACELSVTDGTRVKIHRMIAATDCGYAVNPAQVRRQVSGSFVFALSALFMQECTVKDGRIEQQNFNTYPAMRIAQMPQVETIIIEGGGTWGGVGEPSISVAAPAVLNALYRATGKRIRKPPLKNHGFELV